MTSQSRIAIDTNVLVDLLTGSGSLYAPSKHLIADAEMGQHLIVVSEVSIAEAAKLDGASDVPALVDAFMANKYILRCPVTPKVSEIASGIIRDHALETCDALIVATAILHRARTLYCHDGEARKRIRASQSLPADLPTTVSGMRILSPLFDESLCQRAGIPVGGQRPRTPEVAATKMSRRPPGVNSAGAEAIPTAEEPSTIPKADPVAEASKPGTPAASKPPQSGE